MSDISIAIPAIQLSLARNHNSMILFAISTPLSIIFSLLLIVPTYFLILVNTSFPTKGLRQV